MSHIFVLLPLDEVWILLLLSPLSNLLDQLLLAQDRVFGCVMLLHQLLLADEVIRLHGQRRLLVLRNCNAIQGVLLLRYNLVQVQIVALLATQ